MKLVFVYSKKKLSGKLTKLFTGSYCYHVGWLDEEKNKFYDMNLIRRRMKWNPDPRKHYIMVDPGVDIPREYLEEMLESDSNIYGFLDYIKFGLRPIYHFFGASTRNSQGVICSEMVYNDLLANGWRATIFKEVPSPADLEIVFGVKWDG